MMNANKMIWCLSLRKKSEEKKNTVLKVKFEQLPLEWDHITLIRFTQGIKPMSISIIFIVLQHCILCSATLWLQLMCGSIFTHRDGGLFS